MVTAICQKTGIEFEAASKRVKNHPAIMREVERANKEQWYNECLDALAAGRAAKLDTIEQFVELLHETREASLNQQFIDYKARLEEKRRDKAYRIARYEAWKRGDLYREPATFSGDNRDAFQAMMDENGE